MSSDFTPVPEKKCTFFHGFSIQPDETTYHYTGQQYTNIAAIVLAHLNTPLFAAHRHIL